MRWIGVALLSASWLFGLSYYQKANWIVWIILVVLGTIFLLMDRFSMSGLSNRLETGFAIVMLIPAVWFIPLPYRVFPLLMVIGLTFNILPVTNRWVKYISRATFYSGIILLVQSLVILAYIHLTARSHELPYPLPQFLGVIARLLGIESAVIDSAVYGTNIALFSMRKVHLLGATWELFLDPVTLCFLMGGIVLISLQVWINPTGGKSKRELIFSLSKLIGLVITWLPIRTGLLIALYMHQVLRTDYDAPLKAMYQFWNQWVYLFLLIVPVLMTWRFVRLGNHEESNPKKCSSSCGWKSLIPIGFVMVSIGTFTAGILWEIPGERKDGRVFVDEYHSEWEPTDRTYNTTEYGEMSGYNYACIYDYCSRFYEMSRLNKPIDDSILRDCDVLIVKVPTSPYKPEEIEAIQRFVKRGGGLMLIGDHTNVFKTGNHLNTIAQTFGFKFRYDCLFGIDSPFDQLYRPPLIPHPIVQHMPPMDFATSCSIAPGKSLGKAVICSTGLWSLPADYHASNFYPQVEERAEMRYGAFIQLWAMHYGAGRVAAFTDSTIFSNFCTFEPGKSELMLGMIEWLNYRNLLENPQLWLISIGFSIGLLLLACALILAYRWNVSWILMLVGGILGWTMTAIGIRTVHSLTMPAPQNVRPMVEVVIDRTICDAPLSKSGFIEGSDKGFGIFELWILRLGYFTSRQSGVSAFKGDLLVLFYPHKNIDDEYLNRLITYVSSGGKVLILDSPENTNSKANSLLSPFGMTLDHKSPMQGGKLQSLIKGWPEVRVNSACEIKGGQPLILLNGKPVASIARYGKGFVTVIGFGSRFTDYNMGVTADVVPDANLRQVYELQFSILRAIIENKIANPIK